MKSLVEIKKLNAAFERRFGLKIEGAEQGSERWMQSRLGVISASNALKAVSKTTTETRFTYLAELVAQICTGMTEEINGRALDWGKQNEAASRAYYEFSTDHKITESGFIFKDDSFRIGCSADGLVNDKKGLEIKCPWNTGNYIKFLLEDDIKSEWSWQTNFSMWVLGCEQWDFSMYDPRMQKNPMKLITIGRDDKKIAVFEDLVPQLIHDIDMALNKIGIEFGSQWSRLAAGPSMEQAT